MHHLLSERASPSMMTMCNNPLTCRRSVEEPTSCFFIKQIATHCSCHCAVWCTFITWPSKNKHYSLCSTEYVCIISPHPLLISCWCLEFPSSFFFFFPEQSNKCTHRPPQCYQNHLNWSQADRDGKTLCFLGVTICFYSSLILVSVSPSSPLTSLLVWEFVLESRMHLFSHTLHPSVCNAIYMCALDSDFEHLAVCVISQSVPPLSLVCTSPQGFLPLTCFSHVFVWPCEPVKSVDVTSAWLRRNLLPKERKRQVEAGINTMQFHRHRPIVSYSQHLHCVTIHSKLCHTVAVLGKNCASEGKVKKKSI